MGRPQRRFIPGATYHVMLRGNNGQRIFPSDTERSRFCLLMQQGIERFGHRIIAFCLMPNHVHLAIQAGEVTISKIFHNLAFRYSQYIHHIHGTSGHLFQGRFRSIIVDSENYLRGLIRYIHLNPVRAGLANRPVEYRWSSHRAYMQEEYIAWLSVEEGLRRFGDSLEAAVVEHNRFAMAGLDRDPEVDFERGITDGVLGESRFVEAIRWASEEQASKRVTAQLSEVVGAASAIYGITPAYLRSGKRDQLSVRVRSLIFMVAVEIAGIGRAEVARCFSIHPTAVSKTLTRLHQRLQVSPELEQEAAVLIGAL